MCIITSTKIESYCFITGFYDIGRGDWNDYKRGSNNYLNYFKILLQVNIPCLVVYIDKKYHHEVNKLIATYRTPNALDIAEDSLITRVIPIDESFLIKNVRSWLYIGRIRKILNSNDFQDKVQNVNTDPMSNNDSSISSTNRSDSNVIVPERKIAEYSAVTHAKIDLVLHTIENKREIFTENYHSGYNNSNSSDDINDSIADDIRFFAWIDFGFLRETYEIMRFKFNLQAYDTGKFNLFNTRNEIEEDESEKQKQLLFEKNDINASKIGSQSMDNSDEKKALAMRIFDRGFGRVHGGLWCADEDVLKRLHPVYHDTLNYFYSLNLVDAEQTIMEFMSFSNPELVLVWKYPMFLGYPDWGWYIGLLLYNQTLTLHYDESYPGYGQRLLNTYLHQHQHQHQHQYQHENQNLNVDVNIDGSTSNKDGQNKRFRQVSYLPEQNKNSLRADIYRLRRKHAHQSQHSNFINQRSNLKTKTPMNCSVLQGQNTFITKTFVNDQEDMLFLSKEDKIVLDQIEVKTDVSKMIVSGENMDISSSMQSISKSKSPSTTSAPSTLKSSFMSNPSLSLHTTYSEGGPARVLCSIFTFEQRHANARTVADTWGHRCTGFMAFSNKTDPTIPTIQLYHEGDEHYENMWQKTRSIWKYIGENYLGEFDYFLLGGDDMYYIMDNFAHLLHSQKIRNQFNSNKGVYLGRQLFYPNEPLHFNSGGAGYILDKNALNSLLLKLDTVWCHPHLRISAEDVFLANCLKQPSTSRPSTSSSLSSPILPMRSLTLDSQGKERFHVWTPGESYQMEKFLNKYQTEEEYLHYEWYGRYNLNHQQQYGLNCCSIETISFQTFGKCHTLSIHKYLNQKNKREKKSK